MSNVIRVPLSQIRENQVSLRTVNRTSEQYLGLVSSIEERGFMGAITARQKVDPETGEQYYEIVDGLHRYNAAIDAGIEEINIDVVDLNDVGVFEVQLMANLHKVETKPAQYAKQLQTILNEDPTLTESELAKRLGVSPDWLKRRLRLNDIENEQIRELVDSGEINLVNAVALSKLPPDEMVNMLDMAITKPSQEFVPLAEQRVKEIREANRKGLNATPNVFNHNPFLRPIREIKAELENGQAGNLLVNSLAITDPIDAFRMGIQWCMNSDPISVDQKRADWQAAQEKKAEERKKREEERARKKDEAKQDAAIKRAIAIEEDISK